MTPQPTANRPGLSALTYRVGMHATFLDTMKARLSSTDFPALVGLKTRDPGDPAIALPDAWATVPDVLRYSVSSWRQGRVSIQGVDALVAAMDADNDALFDAGDTWSVLEASAGRVPPASRDGGVSGPAERAG